MYIFKKKSDLTRVIRYLFFVVLIIWLLSSIFIIYDYGRESSEYIVSKGGTYVEGITEPISYLPYLNNDSKSLFYQGLLFRACLDSKKTENGQIEYINDLCNISTKDNKEFIVTLETQTTWSNGVPLSINDIFFTYQDIIINNSLNSKGMEIWAGTEVSLESDQVKVIFKNESFDNISFFTNYILPEHVLISPNIDMYKQEFAIAPVYSSCAKIQNQSKDIYSLIFDLSECEDTNIGFYQIKKLDSIDSIQQSIADGKGSIIDSYSDKKVLTGYSNKQLDTDKYAILFFNTKSNNLLVRTRRALGGFINENLNYQEDNRNLLKKYDNNIFKQFWSTGTNVDEFIDIQPNNGVSLKSLKDSGIEQVPDTIDIKGTNNAFVYYLNEEQDKTKLNFKFDKADYSKISVVYNDGDPYYPSSYSKSRKTANYIISIDNENLVEGQNTYVVYGNNGDKKNKLATITIYKFTSQENIAKEDTIKIVYIDNEISNYLASKLQNLFSEEGIDSKFNFDKLDSLEELETRLTLGNYDIVIGVINSSMKEGFYKFITSDSTKLNPTNYNSPQLSSLIKQYETNKDIKTLEKINEIYANDMPFVLLGTELINIVIKDSILKNVEGIKYRHEYNWQDNIYKNLSLTENRYIDDEKFWNFEYFKNYILGNQEK